MSCIKRAGLKPRVGCGAAWRYAAVVILAGVAASPSAVAEQDLQSRFERLDADGDGEIAWEEAYDVRASEFLEMDEDRDGIVAETEFGGRALPFTSFDADGDGAMMLSEYIGQHRRMFEKFDADGSDTIDQAEFEEAQAAVRGN